MAGLFLPTTRTSQPSQWLPGAAQNSLARGLSELLIPHHFKTAIRGIAPTTIGTGLRLRQYPLGTFFGPASFANNSTVGSLIVPGMGWRLTPPFTIGLVGVLQSTSSPVGLAECYTNNNSGWRITATTQQLQGVVTRAGATVTITDPATTDIHEPFVLMFAVTATTTELFVNGVSVATGSHSSYSAGTNTLYVGMASGSTTNPGGVALLAGWNRIPSAIEVREFAQNPWQICPPSTRQIWVDAPASGGITLTAAQGTYTLTGQSVNLTIARRVTAEQGTYTLTGQDVTLRQGKTLTAEQGTYTLTEQSASLLVSRQISLAQGSYTLTGQDVTLTKSGGDKTLTAGQGTYTLTGYDVSLSLARKLTAEQGTYTLNGQDVGLSRNGRVLQAAQGTYTLNGQEVTLNYSGQPPNAYDIVLARRRLRK